MSEFHYLCGPLAILAMVGLTKYLTGKQPIHDLGIVYEKLPRVCGMLLLLMAYSAWKFSEAPRIPNVILWHTEVGAPILAVFLGLIGIVFVLLGPASYKLINPRPQEVANTTLQSVTMWSITLLSVAFGLGRGLLWR